MHPPLTDTVYKSLRKACLLPSIYGKVGEVTFETRLIIRANDELVLRKEKQFLST